MRISARWMLATTMGLGLALTSSLQAQSLAELAKQEKERREKVASKFRILSNQDAAKFQNGAVTTGEYGGEPAKPIVSEPLAAPADTATALVRDEAYWRARFQELTGKVQALDNKSVLAQLQLNELRNQFYSEQNGFRRGTIQTDIQNKLVEVDSLATALKAAQKELSDFQADARRNNVPAGWIR